jgi:hypothetical protein
MELRKLAILSTAHLHPLEAKQLDKFAYVSDQFSSLYNVDLDMIEIYSDKGLVILSKLIKLVKEKYDVDYVLFEPDANVSDEFTVYDW